MDMLYLIDGYNLLHAAGYAPPRGSTRTSFDTARARFLDWLATAARLKSGEVRFRVVFDAQNSEAPIPGRNHRGVEIEFSHRQTADDVIEAKLKSSITRTETTVVSNDVRLRSAALRSGAFWQCCEEFLDEVLERARKVPPTVLDRPEKPEQPGDDLAELLRIFQSPRN